MYYLWSVDLSKSFSQLIVSIFIVSKCFSQLIVLILIFPQYVFNLFFPVEKCLVTPYYLYRDSLTLIAISKFLHCQCPLYYVGQYSRLFIVPKKEILSMPWKILLIDDLAKREFIIS